MRTVTVTIGRNVGTDPLPAEDWNDFVFGTRRAVEVVTSELWAQGPSRGSWDGVSEDAFFFYGPVAAMTDDVVPALIRHLRALLSVLATRYRQEAIGLSVGEPELVESFDTPAPIGGTS